MVDLMVDGSGARSTHRKQNSALKILSWVLQSDYPRENKDSVLQPQSNMQHQITSLVQKVSEVSSQPLLPDWCFIRDAGMSTVCSLPGWLPNVPPSSLDNGLSI